ncbi:MAG: hypothetical protein HQ494_11090 [Rhodospirillales bacterium]|nr:hypothetical protein [Rhodospirillales bacterium]
MVMDDLNAEISFLMQQLESDPGDFHEIFFRLHQALSTLRAEGLPVPENLARMEKDLDARFADDLKG